MDRYFGKGGGRGKAKVTFGDEGRPSRQNRKGYLSEELMSHYRRVSDTLGQFGSEENVSVLDHSKSEFLNNVVSSLAEELVQVSQNQTVSSIVESIVAAASPSNLRTLFVSAVTDLSVAFLDRFACHVFEALVLRLPEFYEQPTHDEEDDEDDDVSQDKVLQSFEAMCEFVDSQFETLVTHMYGSHVLRALYEALSGVPVAHELKKSQKSGHGRHSQKDGPLQTQKQKSPEKFKTLFDNYATKLFKTCDYEVHLKDPFFSLMIQAVLMILHKVDADDCRSRCKNMLQRVQESCVPSDDPASCVPDMAQDTAGTHLLEVIFKLSDADQLQLTFESLLRGKMLYYATHPTGNYVLQSFMSFVQDKDLMVELFEELSAHLEDVLAVGYFGLVTSLAQGCRRLRIKQDEFITAAMEAFHCKEPQERQKVLMRLIASFTAYETFFTLEEGKDTPAEGTEVPSLKAPVNIHGSLLIQELLRFQKPKHAALGLLDLQSAELQMLCCDPAGSHVIDVFFSSASVLEKNRDIFLRKLKGLVVDVACSKNGSRCLESVWKNLNVTQRTALAKELAESERIRSDRFGHFLHRNFQLEQFATNRKLWLEWQGSQAKRKRLVKELLHKTEPPAKKKKNDQDHVHAQDVNPIEDSVTAIFIKQKKELDARELLTSSQAAANSQDGSQDGSQVLSPLCSDSPTTEGKKKKKKKRKDKSEQANTSPLKTSKHEGDLDSGDNSGSVETSHQEEEKKKERKKKKKMKKI